eukprot:TRINITY_DN7286_c0_g2_i1.p1 TRINITY_DN7286_c0_g2~~TRINITY_DN7286_c0_g2_i1.p1  ORF type:complete len:727 (+),score=180.47 TRINITY_DN7286_c0_g2_i1:151-2331(+)
MKSIRMRPRSTTYGKTEDFSKLQARLNQEIVAAQMDPGTRVFFGKLSRLCFTAMGFDNEQTEEIVGFMSTKHARNRVQSNGVPDQRTVNALMEAVTLTNEYLSDRKYIRLLVRVQAIIRGWLVRRRFKQTSKETFNTLRSRNGVFGELLKTEEQYTECIDIIVKEYLEPIRQSTIEQRPVMEPQDMASIFCNIEVISQTHAQILESLKELTSDWPFVDGIGKAFLKIAPSLKVYGVYVQNFKLAMDVLDRLGQAKGRWKAFLDSKKEPAKAAPKSQFLGVTASISGSNRSTVSPSASVSNSSSANSIPSSAPRDLKELLRMPLDRIQKYESFLQDIEHTTPPDHRDWQDIVSASALMKQTSAFVQQSLDQADQRAKILGVQRRLVGYEGPLNLLDGKRKFCCEGFVVQTTTSANKAKTAKRYLFLFNNLLIITKHVKQGYQVKKQLPISAGDEVQGLPDTPSSKFNFSFTHQKEKFVFSAKTNEEKAHWLAMFTVQLKEHDKDRVFGMSLTDLLAKEKRIAQVPKIVEDVFKYFEANPEAMQVEGIFRQSGLKDVILEMKAMCDRGEKIDWSTPKSPHDVSGLFKMFLRELPDPLFPFTTYSKIMSLSDQLDGPNGQPTREGLDALRDIIISLPDANKILLKELCRFLRKVTKLSDVNKMTTHNISIVFGPNLIRPKEETIETSLELPKVNLSFKLIIEHWATLFDEAATPRPAAVAEVPPIEDNH